MKKLISILLIGVLACSLVGCEDRRTTQETADADPKVLTREKALAMIKRKGMEPVTEDLRLGPCYVAIDSAIKPAFIDACVKSGHLDTIPQGSQWPEKGAWPDNLYARPSASGKEFVFRVAPDGRTTTLRMADLHPQNVTGIGAPSQMFGKTVSVVNFDYLYFPTPFGMAQQTARGMNNLYSGRAKGIAYFALYDDGWQFEQWQRAQN